MSISVEYAASLASNARRGAELLDVRKPGWASLIEKDIYVRDPSCCPLGQVYGSYSDGRFALALSRDDVFAFGFDAANDFVEEYNALDAAWEREVNDRLSA